MEGFLVRHAWAVLLCTVLFDVITGLSPTQLVESSVPMLLAHALGLLLADLPIPAIAWGIARFAFRKLPGSQSARIAALWAAGGFLVDVAYRLLHLSQFSN